MVGKGDYQNTQLEFVTMQALLGSSHKRSHKQKTREQKLQEIKASWRKMKKEGTGNERPNQGTDTEKSELDKGLGEWKVLTGMIYLSKSLWYLIFRPKEGGATNSNVRTLWRLRHSWSSHFLKRQKLEIQSSKKLTYFAVLCSCGFLQFLCCCHSIILWLLGPHSIPNY